MGRPTGVTVIAILDFIAAAFCVLFGLVLMLSGGILSSVLNQQRGQGNGEIAAILAGVGAALGIFCIIIAAIDIVLAVGLLKLKEWARIATIVLTAIFAALVLLGLFRGLIHFNLITTVIRVCVLAIQAFIILYLLKPEVKAAFQGPQVRAASA